MNNLQNHLQSLYQGMEKAIFHYQGLIEEMKKESEYLKQGSHESLIKSANSIEIHTTEIQKVNALTGRAIEEILSFLGREDVEKSISGLMSVLPPEDYRKLKAYQRMLGSLKERVKQINEWNKSFIQESLNYWKDLVSSLIFPLDDSPVYIPNGHKKPLTNQPYALNWKV